MRANDDLQPRGFSLKYRIAAIIFVLEAVMMASVLGVTLTYSTTETRKQFTMSEQTMANLLADLSRIALLTAEYDELQPYLDKVVADPHVDEVLLTDRRDRVVVSTEHARIGEPMPELVDTGSHIWRIHKIGNVSGTLGTLAVRFSHEQLIATRQEVLNLGVTVALIGMLVIAVVGVGIGFLLTRRLDRVAVTARSLTRGNFSARTRLKGNDEVAILGRSFDRMADAVEQNMGALRKVTDSLEQRVAKRTRQLADARDEAVSANRSKSAFLANMSHEIRTPLTAVIGFSESLLDSRQSMTERVEAINTIIRSGKHLLGVINDILDVSKIEADRLEVEHIPFNLCDIVADVEALALLQAQDKGLAFDVECTFPLPRVIVNDPVRLKQVLINLCNNAIKFTAKGTVHVELSCDRAEEQLMIKVIDTGIGMTQEQVQRLFQPFAQADASTTREFGGTGLGLHLSKQLAQQMGGDITVHSAPDVGSCFTVTISTGPLDDVELIHERPPVQAPTASTEAAKPPSLMGRVLLAEDNTDNQQLISMYLRNVGAHVSIAGNGQEAVRQASDGTYDLVLMDMQMPVKDGLAAARELRSLGCTTPIVALTANALKSDAEACLAAGCDEFLTKPLDRGRFHELLSQYLEPNRETSTDEPPIVSPLLDEGPEFAALVRQFVERLPAELSGIHEFYAAGDLDGMKNAVHTLKGTGGNFGFEAVFDLARKLEFEIIAHNHADIDALLEELADVVSRIQRGLPLTSGSKVSPFRAAN